VNHIICQSLSFNASMSIATNKYYKNAYLFLIFCRFYFYKIFGFMIIINFKNSGGDSEGEGSGGQFLIVPFYTCSSYQCDLMLRN
jgi:hypothetical protein